MCDHQPLHCADRVRAAAAAALLSPRLPWIAAATGGTARVCGPGQTGQAHTVAEGVRDEGDEENGLDSVASPRLERARARSRKLAEQTREAASTDDAAVQSPRGGRAAACKHWPVSNSDRGTASQRLRLRAIALRRTRHVSSPPGQKQGTALKPRNWNFRDLTDETEGGVDPAAGETCAR